MKNCDLFLLTTNFDYESFIEPMGISILASIIKEKGYNVQVLEPSVCARSAVECTRIIVSSKPRIVGISILIDLHMDSIIAMIKDIRRCCEDVIIFVGGQAITMNYNQAAYSELIKEVDFFMYGESESVFGILVDNILKKSNWKDVRGIGYYDDGILKINLPAPKIENLDELPEMDRSVLEEIIEKNPKYCETSVPYGRGCSKNCTFCSEVFFRDESVSKVRRRSLENVFNEIEKLYKKYGIQSFNIEDESFLDVNEEEYMELRGFFEKIENLSKNIELKILGRIDQISEKMARILYKGRVSYMFLGVDSVVEEDLKLFNKGYSPDTVYRNLDILLKVGYSLAVDSEYRISTGYITWHPYTTLKGLRTSYEFFRKYSNTPKLLQHKLIVFSSTPLIKKIKKDGLLLTENLPAGKFEYQWKFVNNDVSVLYDYMLKYFYEWTPIRDGIRTIEKYVAMEKKEYKEQIEQIRKYRIELDEKFYTYFDEILVSVEEKQVEYLDEVYTKHHNDLELYIESIFSKLNHITRIIGFGEDLPKKLRDKNLWICRYRN